MQVRRNLKKGKSKMKNNKTKNILFCGVGGQGILLCSEIVAYALMWEGFDIKKSEVHGMAQRGGAVVAFLRFGSKVYSPLIEYGDVDICVGLELMEPLRYTQYFSKQTKVILNLQKILPVAVSTGVESYPEDPVGVLKKMGLKVYPIEAFELCKKIGETRAVNMAMVGALSWFLPVKVKTIESVIRWRLPERLHKLNLQAFREGRRALKR